jgi:hypothetical protein
MTVMKYVARNAACALAVLIASSTVAPADPSGCQWDADGNCWMFTPMPIRDHTRPVEFRDVGIILSVTPIVGDSKAESHPLFVLLDDAIYVNVGTEREPRWEPIGEREFWFLVAEFEQAGFGLVTEVVEEELIVKMVLIF